MSFLFVVIWKIHKLSSLLFFCVFGLFFFLVTCACLLVSYNVTALKKYIRFPSILYRIERVGVSRSEDRAVVGNAHDGGFDHQGAAELRVRSRGWRGDSAEARRVRGGGL